jgi:hypothetical protein
MTARNRAIRGFLALGALALAPLADAADGWIGNWRVNTAKSKYSPGPAPKEGKLSYEVTPDGVRVTSDGIVVGGQQRTAMFVAPFDGTEVAYSGHSTAEATAPLRVSDRVYTNVLKKGGKVLNTIRVEVSPDGRTLTATIKGRVNNVVVYDRIP